MNLVLQTKFEFKLFFAAFIRKFTDLVTRWVQKLMLVVPPPKLD